MFRGDLTIQEKPKWAVETELIREEKKIDLVYKRRTIALF